MKSDEADSFVSALTKKVLFFFLNKNFDKKAIH